MLISSFVFSQKSQQQLAYQYYINGEYHKAISIYKELERSSFSVSYYMPYFGSLLKIKDYKLAEKLAKKVSRIYPRSLNYMLEVAIAQDRSGSERKATQTYRKLFRSIDGTQSQAIQLANTFKRYDMFEKALNVYSSAEKINHKSNFRMQKAQLYANLGKMDLMINEYLDELSFNHNSKKIILSKVQLFLNNDGIKSDYNYKLVKKALLPYVRKEDGRSDFSEMLIWLFMQNSQYEMALTQAKSLDRRTNSEGEGVYDLADSFLDKKLYELAIDAYDYVIQKGVNNFLFIDANINKLYSLTQSIGTNYKQLNILDKSYQKIITKLGENQTTVLLLSNYAHFKAFYLHDLDSAKDILEKAMAIPQISDLDLADCKLEYADVMLLVGNVWQSLLYYSQVEKDFKENPIGHEAKLRRARIAYYQGDFAWAQAQLGVLKSSTSKLIANDAMALSLLIIDNLNLDTSNIPMETFARADLLNYQQRFEEAISMYDSILTAFSGHSLSDEIYMRKASIYIKLNNLDSAIEMYQNIELLGYDILEDDALYRLAKLYDDLLNEKIKAMKLYEKILVAHSSSIFVSEARKRFREIRGDNLEY